MQIRIVMWGSDSFNWRCYIVIFQGYAETIMAQDYECVTVLEPEFITALKGLWADDELQVCYNRRREYQLTDSAK